MTVKLSTTLSNLERMLNKENIEIIQQFFHF
jgi:hypothetical protein